MHVIYTPRFGPVGALIDRAVRGSITRSQQRSARAFAALVARENSSSWTYGGSEPTHRHPRRQSARRPATYRPDGRIRPLRAPRLRTEPALLCRSAAANPPAARRVD